MIEQSVPTQNVKGGKRWTHKQDITRLSHLLRRCNSPKQLKPLKALLIVHGLIHDPLFVGPLLDSCFRLGAPRFALSTFGAVAKRPAVSLLNLVVKGLARHGLYEDVLSAFRAARLRSSSYDRFAFPFVIKACSALGAFGSGREVHCVVLRSGYGGNEVVGAGLVGFYARLGCLGTALKVFDGISQPDLVCFNALISGCSYKKFDGEVFAVLRRVFEVGLRPNSSTLASVIPVCTRLRRLDVGRCLHGLGIKCGCFANDFLVPSLISMYASDGRGRILPSSRKLFDCVVKKSVATWNAMISAYTRNDMTFEAFEVFQEMLHGIVRPDLITFVSIIPSLGDAGSNWSGESVHSFIVKDGWGNQVPVLTALVTMYAKLGDIDAAEYVFSSMSARTILSWNAMIAGYVCNDLWYACLDAFVEMQISGVGLDAVSIVSVLSACSKVGAILLGKSAHAFSIRLGIDSDNNASNGLLSFYSGVNRLDSSFNLLNRMHIRNNVSWNIMISSCVHNGEEEMAIVLLKEMQKEGTVIDVVTLISVLPVFHSIESLGQGRTLHGYAIKKGFDFDVSCANSLISMYSNCGHLEAGRMVFETMPVKGTDSWNALMTAFRNHNLRNEVLSCLYQMKRDDLKLNSVTLLNLVAVSESLLQCRSIHAFAMKTGISQEDRLLSSLISMYARFKSSNFCLNLFEMGEKRTISLWNAVISGLVQINMAEKAVAFFHDLLSTELQPDNVTILSLISACALLNIVNHARSLMAYLIHKGFLNDAAIGNALVDLFARCGDLSTAKSIFGAMIEKDTVSWNVMINGYVLHGNAEDAFRTFSEMQLLGIRPDNNTYSSLLSICSHAGLVEKCFTVFDSMVKHGTSPRMEHHGCVVDMLGRAGRLDEAYGILKNLPFIPPVSFLESLLGACRLHGNVQVGEQIGNMMFEMDPDNPGLYSMLSSLYAEAGRWKDAENVRSLIEGRHLRKIPGFSLVQHHSLLQTSSDRQLSETVNWQASNLSGRGR